LAINDALPDDNQYSSDQYGVEVAVLSDPDAVVMSSYKIRDSFHDPITRETFLIDPTGRIVWHWPTIVAEGHVDRINAKIVELGGK
jgi:peroxiredoxin